VIPTGKEKSRDREGCSGKRREEANRDLEKKAKVYKDTNKATCNNIDCLEVSA